ncbi:ATP-binding protein [Piscinibacter sakaiensis]|uniref:AAA family ATPase n=1 Tax=Piscinibacter sakaiensis TaxID=1547922 RepID=UPI0006B60F00|nr:ATP-binding protein [Piscinibacter sakaiensis]
MLLDFSLEDFKSYRKASLPLGALTVLIGANAAGKSNAIEALRFLSWLAQGQKLGAISYAVNTADKVVRGRISDLCRAGSNNFTLRCSINETRYCNLKISIGIRDDELHVVAERMSGLGDTVPLYDLDQPSKGVGTDARVAYNNFAKGGNKPHLTVSDQLAVFTQLDSPASFQPTHKHSQIEIPKAVKTYQEVLGGILFLDPVPARMRDYSFATDKRLKGDGENLSSVLFSLWRTGEMRAHILAFIQSLPEQDIEELKFLKGPRGEVMVQLVETFGTAPKAYDAPLLSDGTLRVLAIAAAMLSADEGSLVVIEEIDNGVHPSRASHLLEQIDSVARQRKLRVLLTTHNPALLDALPTRALSDVVFCYRDKQGGDSKLIRLADVPDSPELFAKGTLGQLVTTGALERFVKHRPSATARRRSAMRWLQSVTEDDTL